MPQITDKRELARLQRSNNPSNEPTGHYTGRCAKCGSKDLWSDCTAYGCRCCGAIYMTGDMVAIVPNGTTHNAPNTPFFGYRPIKQEPYEDDE